MKKQVKNLFALFLTASMAVSLVPADAFAAVHDAVKDATTTTAYEKVEAEKKAAQPKAGSAEAAIQEALYTNTDEVDLSKYNLTERKAEKLTDKKEGLERKLTDLNAGMQELIRNTQNPRKVKRFLKDVRRMTEMRMVK